MAAATTVRGASRKTLQVTLERQASLPAGVVEQVRTGGVATLGDTGIASGIGKQPRCGPVRVHALGLGEDEQAEAFHGGSERAILQYDSEHYRGWAAELPGIARQFVPGAFGENLVVRGMNEGNMCIGDVVAAGSSLLQVTESRAPCYKLNHRFGHPDMARLTQEKRRTGFFYRVLVPGAVSAGDRIEVVGRPLPHWPLDLVQSYMYAETGDLDAAAELAELPLMSKAFRAIFQRRLESSQVEDWTPRLSNGPVTGRALVWFEAEVSEIVRESRSVMSFRFTRADGEPMQAYEPGSHIQIELPNGSVRSYSLCEPSDGETLRVAVALAADSRGASSYMHHSLPVGSRLRVSEPDNFFPLAEADGRHVLVAGGIGVTPFLSMIAALEERQADWQLLYLTREREDAAFADWLQAEHAERVQVFATRGADGARPDLTQLLAARSGQDHVYCCGPQSLRTAVAHATEGAPEGTIHFEAFQAPESALSPAFTVTPTSTGVTIEVPEGQTLLYALRAAGFSIPSSCETGTCGTCRLSYRSGDVVHHDVMLTSAERRGELLCCVSRARGDLELEL